MDNHEIIMKTLGELTSEVKGINSRLDRMNGAVSENTRKIALIELWKEGLSGKLSVIYIFVGGIITVVVNWVVTIVRKDV